MKDMSLVELKKLYVNKVMGLADCVLDHDRKIDRYIIDQKREEITEIKSLIKEKGGEI